MGARKPGLAACSALFNAPGEHYLENQMTPALFKQYLYPAAAGIVAVALVVDGLFFSQNPERIITGLAILAPGVVSKKP